ncbi:BREX-1 system adenine-specific DNA-methyltransferase PglX [Lactobacillus delbrueckii]|uniref:BREX-1 system adenine-specific DNA-methyltransferase PglX n=1 Tax=Lactobacillus delbrueckii TaxID=1584 RepID=UPI00067FACEE|nr:BREX-1 system adenine-specific DNA-methyltransferase PglX [Lactobacillus delbrueckii]APG74825.1 SAM-dependent methyltransferase [Lactobacillus delbrueckii subsp. sunkii]KNE73920.1 type II deoxyribonuclease [Lactobacillus delbrueckii subsp. sunkii]GHN12025.1 restriction endonuclease subunit M [Lactobacillus delbrueckii subsp. sunkii]GHN14299.1 restriction endonuclease subunit M [Lactobacillus delbrueckii subsp. sunkii]
MEKNAIKKFAVWARTELLTRVAQRAARYGIEKDDMIDANADSINGVLLSQDEKKQRRALIRQINEKGYDQVVEEVAYTWFNRFIALRFMEVNGYLPSHIRVFTNENNEFIPEILSEAINLDFAGLDMQKVYQLQDENKTEELYRYLLIVQCNELNSALPKMFQRLNDYTELLLPDNLLRNGSVLEQMVSLIPEDDWKDQVQIIGWLYQYYNSELKDKVFADLKKKIKISKDSIPAATQLFTPDWIVRYMVDNSLGRMWYEGHPSESFKEKLKYYIDDAKQEADVQAQVDAIKQKYSQLKPEEIKCIDPCCGSGHILVYFFDVLMNIYQEYGYSTREAAISIVKNNIWGLDIDERAAQLAYFSIMMKARAYDRRFFSRNIQPHVYEIRESNNIDQASLEEIYQENKNIAPAIKETLDELYDAKEYGSILQTKQQDWKLVYDELMSSDSIYDELIQNELIPILEVGQALSQQYDVVVTNPPYMGSSGMDKKLSSYVKKHYPNSKADMFAVFIEVCGRLTKDNGLYGMITQQSWMFLSSFEKLRKELQKQEIINMVHLGAHAFEEIGGEVVQTTSFVLSNNSMQNYIGTYCRLIEPTTQLGKETIFLEGKNRYFTSQVNFTKIPGSPIAYWIDMPIFNIFDNKPIGTYVISPSQNVTGNNNKYTRLFWELNKNEVNKKDKWIFYAKGGNYRKWWGNLETVVNWTNKAREVYQFGDGRHASQIINKSYWYKKGITWGLITSSRPSFRIMPKNATFDKGGTTIISKDESNYLYILSLLNSKVYSLIASIFNPTLNFQLRDVLNVPLIFDENKERVKKITSQSISLSKIDWDSFETSWDFKVNPLIKWQRKLWPVNQNGVVMYSYYGYDPIVSCPLEYCYMLWQRECNERFNRQKVNEEELNRIFINIYGLQDVLTPGEEDKDVSIRKADLGRDIRSFISYAVGCMFGRYSLDKEGLIYAGGEWDPSQYKTCCPDEDNILPITDDDYFEDDIVDRFVKFVEIVYGTDTLEENLKFIADALGNKGSTPREVIRNYFLNDFYKDHCQTYSVTGSGKRPIYWLFDSGKKNGFKCLIYMHRYTPDTLARIRTDYVHPQQARYQTAIEDIERQLVSASGSEKVRLNKRLKKLKDQAEETRIFEEKLHHLADQMINIDLDDGVKHNYALFKDVLAKIK